MGASPVRYHFADLTLDVGQRRLSRGEETIALSKLTFALLNTLVEAAPNIVTHAELADRVWGPRRIVTPENLAKRVMRLRAALGDRADAPRYVEGLRGQGYRLIPSVESDMGTADAGASAPMSTPALTHAHAPTQNAAPRRASATRRLAVAATIALAAMVAVVAYRLPMSLGTPAEASVVAKHPPKIVVLPFANLSSDPEHRHFADGLTEELIIGLQRLPGVKIMSSTTSFALRDSHRGAKEIAADLDVQYVLEGSVGSDGERLRVRAQLTDATGFGVLPYSYEGTLDNVFAVQDEIVGAIAAAVRTPLGLEPAVARAGTSHVEAYELYLAAKLECTEGHKTPEGFERALRLIDRAIAIDPKFARAWMFKSQVHTMRAGFTAGGAAEIAAADEAATHAIGLAPDYGDGYNARALLRVTSGDWRGAAADYDRARAHGVTEFPHDIAFILSSGRFGKARERIKELLDADPLNEDLLAFLVIADEVLREPDAADEAFRRGRLLYEQWEFGDRVGVWIREGRERVEPPYDHIALPQPFGDLAEGGDSHAARALLEQALHDPQNQAPTTIGNLAIWAAGHGDQALALKLLRDSIVGSKMDAYIAWLPVFEAARRLPEFKVLLTDLGLVDYWRATAWPDVCRPAGEHDFDCI
ncbi:MAG: winged helix-turn-helix domain-containing protein [Gammaproteobacteria bacterium]